jgi:radical SAM superfamily enzyme YgiQ (UPF0313 family)
MKKPEMKDRRVLYEEETFIPDYEDNLDGEPIALVYPNTYEVAMSSLGYLTIYRLFIDAGFRPERFMYDIRDKQLRCISIESGIQLNQFFKIAFHFSHELDYINAVKMLMASNIDPKRGKREQIIIAGGIATTANPLPMLDFMDAFFTGEMEDSSLINLKGESDSLIDKLSNENGWLVSKKHEKKEYLNIKQATSDKWKEFESFSPIITPNTVFPMMNLSEISRGCPIGCKFCLSGNILKDVREKPLDLVLSAASRHYGVSKKIGLIGATPSLHSQIIPILETLVKDEFQISLSSISVSSLKPELLELLAKGGMKTLTLGIESFDRDLQKQYGKVFSTEKLMEWIKSALDFGMSEIRLYLMLGLPHAKSDESKLLIENVIDLQSYIRKVKPQAGLTISLNPFIPKIATPYVRENFMGDSEFQDEIREIRKSVMKKGVKVKSESGKNAFLQYLLSCGDERMGEIIIQKAEGKNVKSLIKKRFSDLDEYMGQSIEKIDNLIVRC